MTKRDGNLWREGMGGGGGSQVHTTSHSQFFNSNFMFVHIPPTLCPTKHMMSNILFLSKQLDLDRGLEVVNFGVISVLKVA